MSSSPVLSAPRRNSRCAALHSLVLVLALCAACDGPLGQGEQTALAEGTRERLATPVRVATVERREMVQWLDTTTVIESEREIQVFPRASGVLTELLAEEGDAVEEQQLLARIDPREQELAVRDAEVALEESRNAAKRLEIAAEEARTVIALSVQTAEQAERDYNRDQRLFEGGNLPSALSEKALEASRLARDRAASEREQAVLGHQRAQVEAQSAHTAVARAEVSLERARLALTHTQVRSPIAGVVARRMLRLGDSASPAQAAFVVTDSTRLRAIVHRPQREFGLFNTRGGPGAAGELELNATAEALPGLRFRGQVQRTSPSIDPASGSFRVTASFEAAPIEGSSAQRLLPGMLVRVRIATDRRADALVVPKRALDREGEQNFVFAVREGVARRVLVEEGYSDESSCEVRPLEGHALEPGEQVIVVRGRDLEEGAAVAIEP